MPLFSIIVPIYNVEKYLPHCIESILDQQFSDYELLLINDGSTDKSGEICEQYALASNKIRVFNKSNGGVSDARNMGIDYSRGDYLIFIDSDDYILEGALTQFSEILKTDSTRDVLITKVAIQYENGDFIYNDKNYLTETFTSYNKDQIIKWVFNESSNTWVAYRYIVRKDFINDNQLRFLKDYVHEDVDWTPKIFLYAKTFNFSDNYWYVHRADRPGSITNIKSARRTLDVIEIVQMNVTDQAFNDLEDETRKIIFARLVGTIYGHLCSYSCFNSDERKAIIELLMLNTDILRYTKNPKHKLFLYFSKVFGMDFALYVLGKVKGPDKLSLVKRYPTSK